MLFYKSLSGLIFLLCFVFHAFYTSDTYKAHRMIDLLLFGWLGILLGYLSWLANPFYIFALFSQNRKITLVLFLIALLFALSFLRKKELLVSEAPSYEPIVAYGPGYFLWILSMGILLIGESLQGIEIQYGSKVLTILLFTILCSICYSAYYFLGDKSIYRLFAQRSYHFNRLCDAVKEEIYQSVQNIKGIYIDDISGNYSFDKISGNTYGSYRVNFLTTFTGRGDDHFEERNRSKRDETELPYVRINPDKRGERIPIDKLETNLEVRSENLAEDLPKSLGITSHRIYVRSLETNEIIAETSFVSILDESKLCAPTNTDSYSVNDFVLRALNLGKEP